MCLIFCKLAAQYTKNDNEVDKTNIDSLLKIWKKCTIYTYTQQCCKCVMGCTKTSNNSSTTVSAPSKNNSL